MTTIFDVAERANVSITTVSHVFSGKRAIAPATRDRVLEAARELNYAPSRVGQGLATGRNFTLALLLPDPLDLCLVNPFYAELILTVTEACSVAGYSILVFGVGKDGVGEELRSAVQRRALDGVLWVDPPTEDTELARYLRGRGVPTVVAGRPARDDVTLHVRNDRRAIARLAVAHLVALGYRQLALIIGPRHLMVVNDYVAAFQEMVASLTDGTVLDVVYTASWTIKDGRDAVNRLLASRRPPSAVIAMNEPLAVGAVQAARERGLPVPDDLAVVSIGNSHLAAHFSPAITAVDVRTAETGQALVRLLLGLIGGQQPRNPATIIPSTLVVRESTGPVPLGMA